MHTDIVLDILVGTRTSKKRTLKRTFMAFVVCVNMKKNPYKKVLVPTNMSRTINVNSCNAEPYVTIPYIYIVDTCVVIHIHTVHAFFLPG